MEPDTGLLAGRPIGVLVAEGFQELEFWYPVLRLREEGLDVVVIGPSSDTQVTSQLGYPVIPELAVADAAPAGLSALVIPGGAMAQRLLADAATMRLVSAVAATGAVIGALSEGVGLLADADLVKGRRVACPPRLTNLVRDAGGSAAAEGVVADGCLVTARSADDLPAFFRAFTGALAGQSQQPVAA